MSRIPHLPVSLIVLCLSALSAKAQFKPLDVKLGLWETTSKSETGGMPAMPQIPEESLAKLPPAQRAQIEARMKGAGARNHTTKSCITKETLDRGMNFAANDNACTYKLVDSSSSRQVMHSECTHGEVKVVGDITIERLDNEHLKGGMTMKAAEGAMPINVKMTFETKWISSDCGDVKPPAIK